MNGLSDRKYDSSRPFGVGRDIFLPQPSLMPPRERPRGGGGSSRIRGYGGIIPHHFLSLFLIAIRSPEKIFQSTPQTLPAIFQSGSDRSTGTLTEENKKNCRLCNSIVGKITYNRFVNEQPFFAMIKFSAGFAGNISGFRGRITGAQESFSRPNWWPDPQKTGMPSRQVLLSGTPSLSGSSHPAALQ
ncbi:MAG: hypothetical protein A4E33_00084 [Methanoregula sp. PtaB.Bin085]|nr:MAG: hypothetical protein A4E33_00084 [Methanoregula sp. PtaB.Bin085]